MNKLKSIFRVAWDLEFESCLDSVYFDRIYTRFEF